jgi:DNA polymerase
MDTAMDWHTAKALLEWQVELGATDAICDAPVDRFAAAEEARRAAERPAEAPAASARGEAAPDPVAEAEAAAQAAADLPALRAALAAYPHCALKQGARNLVFADGVPGARVMIVGEAPGREEDLEGRPFVGRAGRLLDRMLAAIGLGRSAEAADRGVYITNVLPWRPPRNREPTAEETAMMLPFLRRHVELAAPEVLVIMGNSSAQALLGRKGITRMRGRWEEALGRPALPMLHPAYLLRNPHAKRMAWEDMLTLAERLEAG